MYTRIFYNQNLRCNTNWYATCNKNKKKAKNKSSVGCTRTWQNQWLAHFYVTIQQPKLVTKRQTSVSVSATASFSTWRSLPLHANRALLVLCVLALWGGASTPFFSLFFYLLLRDPLTSSWWITDWRAQLLSLRRYNVSTFYSRNFGFSNKTERI